MVNTGFPSQHQITLDDRKVMVICATNKPNVLDPALCRPGRLDQLVYVPPPGEEERLQILQHFTKDMTLDAGKNEN